MVLSSENNKKHFAEKAKCFSLISITYFTSTVAPASSSFF